MTRFILALLFLSCTIAGAQNLNSLSGTVIGLDSKPVAGASVHVLNTNLGTVTTIDGKFSIEGLNNGKYTLEVTALGYAQSQQDVEVNGEAQVNIELAETATHLEAIVVTAQKREEELQKIPSSISALSSRQIQQYRLWNSRDITAIVPNLYSADPGDNRNVTSLRGITSTSYDPAVATYIDGVNQFGLDTYIAQLFDVERIEVLRGPQGTLYGRNAMGGVINIITKQPTNITKGFAEASIGNYGQQRYGFGFRTPLVKNKLFLGASGVFDRMNGFYTNENNNSSFDKKHSVTGNYYLKYIAGSKWALTLNVKHNQNRNNGAFTLASSPDEALAKPFVVNQNATTTMVDNVFNSSLTANYAGNAFNFSSQSSYQSNYRYYKNPIDGDFSSIDGVSIINNYGNKWNTVKVFTQEFKISSPASATSPLQWTAGTYLYYQHSPVKQATRFGADAQLVGADDTNFSVISTSTARNRGMAIFGQATYKVNNLDFTLGIRQDYEYKKQSVRGQYQHDPDPNPVFDTRTDTTATVSYSALSPKGIISYHITNNALLFASYSRGFRTGGLTQLQSDPSQPPLYAYKPEYSNNVEVGSKNSFFNNRVKVNVAMFYVDVNNAQVPTLKLPEAITITRNTGSLTSKGVEVEFAATPVKGVQIEYNAGINKAKYTSLNLAQNGQEVDLKGKHQIYTPSSTSMLALQYDCNINKSQTLKFIVRGEWMYLGSQYFDLGNSIRQAGYSVLNTRFGLAYKNIDVMFWGRNLTDKKYIAYAYDFGATHLGNPRNYGVTVRANF